MKTLLALLLLIPSLSWGDAHKVKFPFKIFCEETEFSYLTNKNETFYKLLEGNSNNELYFYEMSTQQSNFDEMIKTKLVMHHFDKDILGLSENINGLEWKDNNRIYNMYVYRKIPRIEYQIMTNKNENIYFDCEMLDININSIDYLDDLFTKNLKKDIKKNKF